MRAMILAAGRGKRMRPLTDTTPKPLLRVGGKPLIVWHVERLAAAGFRDVIINHAWLGSQIEQRLGDGSAFGVRLHYSPEDPALETAGGIARALPFFGNHPFLVINGDVWCDWPPQASPVIAQALIRQNAQAWLLLVDNPGHHPHGDFVLAGHEPQATVAGGNTTNPPLDRTAATVQGLRSVSMPAAVGGEPTMTFAGIGIYQPPLFSRLPAGRPAPLAPLLFEAIKEHHVTGSHHRGQWVDVGTPERLAALDRRLSRNG